MSKVLAPNLAKIAMLNAVTALKHINQTTNSTDDLMPNVDDAYDIGKESNRWKNIHISGDIVANNIRAEDNNYITLQNETSYRKRFIAIEESTTLNASDSGAVVLIENITDDMIIDLPELDNTYSGVHYKIIFGNNLASNKYIRIRGNGDNTYFGLVIDASNSRYTESSQIMSINTDYITYGDFFEFVFTHNNKWHLYGEVTDKTRVGFVI